MTGLSPDVPHCPYRADRSRTLLIGLYGLVTFLYWAALYLYVPALPTYVQTKTDSLSLVGFVLAQYGLWQAVTRLPLGIAADWLGRRKLFILAGIVLAAVGAWLLGTASTIGGMAAGRAITGLAASTWVPLTVAFSGLFPPAEAVRATAILTFVGSVGRVVATSATGAVNQIGGPSLAFFLAAGIAVLAAVALLPVREQRRPPTRPSLAGLGGLITRRDVLIPSLLAAVVQYVTWGIPLGFLPILAKQAGAGDVTQGILVSLHIGVVTLGSLAAAAVVNRIGARNLTRACLVLLAAGLGVAVAARGLATLFAAQFLVGLAHGIVYPVLMGLSIQEVADRERTTAMGLHQAVYAAGMFAGPWLSGLLADSLGIRPMFACTAVACLVIGLSLSRLLPRPR